MTKEEKIKEAYGEYYDAISKSIDEDGWVEIMSLDETEVQLEHTNRYIEGIRYDYVRPISLKGIENNNGWIKINPENDNWEKGINVHFILKSGVQGIFINLDDSEYLTLKNRATHYKIIDKTKLPIY